MRKVILVGLVAMAPMWAALAGDSWEREFQQGMSSTSTDSRMKAVTDLDPGVAKARDYLYTVLDTETWYVRGGAIERLGSATGDALEDMKKQVARHRSPFVREGIVYAFGKSRDNVNNAIPGLEDKDVIVRRAAAISIGRVPTKEGIPALVAALDKEKEFEVKVFIREALEKATGQYFGTIAADWRNWWEANKETWKPKEEPKPGDRPTTGDGNKEKTEDEKKAEEAGTKATESTTSLRDVDLTFSESGKGGPLFVMPLFGRNKVYLQKSLSALEDTARIAYIDLPEITKFKGLKNVGGTGVPFYPLDKLADAFDELRQMRKQERIAIMGHGMTGWVAMRYAQKYPKNVSHLILISTWTGNKAWDRGRNAVERNGKEIKQPEQEHYAENRVVDMNGKHNYEPKDPQEAEALGRMDWTMEFADYRNSYCNLWYRESYREMGGCIIPEFDVGKDVSAGNQVPTMVFAGTHPRSLWTPLDDLRSFQRVYPNCEVVQCPRSADMPMLEEPVLFTQAMRAFFKKYPFAKPKK